MNKRYEDLKSIRRRGIVVVFLFCLSFLSLLSSLLLMPIDMKVNTVSIGLAVFGVLVFLASLYQIKKTMDKIKELQEYFLSSLANTDARKFKLFNRLIDENLFQYHFQPIVNAKTGEVFAYEALMRTDESIALSPNEILSIAERENRLYDIERLTFTNTLRIMGENLNTFGFKKLFINSISNHLMKDDDFDRLYKEHGPLFDNVVLEITESSLIDDNGIRSIRKRLRDSGCQLALDDYGAGYNNEAILLNTSPNYVKIDQSILRNINDDPKKQHLVSNIISFAQKNHIKTIAEGVESYEEFVFMIKLGVDYVQGYYTGRPKPVLIQTIPDECLDIVYTLNKKTYQESLSKKVFETSNDSVILSLSELIKKEYSEIYINDKEITLKGEADNVQNFRIHVTDHLKCRITLDQISIRSNQPTISIGDNCSVTLKLNGDNYLFHNGIHVPESSDLTIIGDGNLTIKSNRKFGTGIGGTAEQCYGNITLAGTGTIKVCCSSDEAVAIGGGRNPGNNKITLASGTIQVEVSGCDTVGIGNFKGKADVIIGDCSLQINSIASRSAAIGCLQGNVGIKTSGILRIRSEGNRVVAIGSLADGEGCISVAGGMLDIHNTAHTCTGIGGIGGSIDISIHNGSVNIYSEGTCAVGIGDYTGSGNIRVTNGLLATELYASYPLPIGNAGKKVVIDGGNIQCKLSEGHIAVNSFGVPLSLKRSLKKEDIKYYISYGDASYEYCAVYSDRYPDICIYLPEDVDL